MVIIAFNVINLSVQVVKIKLIIVYYNALIIANNVIGSKNAKFVMKGIKLIKVCVKIK